MMPLQIDVVSDIVCPWCFIGKRYLDTALAAWHVVHPNRPVTVNWRPYFLNPDTPIAGEPYRPFLEHKFGSAQAVDELLARVSSAGQHAGVEFAFDRIQLRANTLRAHRLIHYGQKVGAGGTAINAMVECLFAANFQQGLYVGDLDVLASIAGRCGLDGQQIRAYLESTADESEVRAAAEEARSSGIGGVPCFIFNRRLATTGAQPPEQLRRAMEQAFSTADGAPAA